MHQLSLSILFQLKANNCIVGRGMNNKWNSHAPFLNFKIVGKTCLMRIKRSGQTPSRYIAMSYLRACINVVKAYLLQWLSIQYRVKAFFRFYMPLRSSCVCIPSPFLLSKEILSSHFFFYKRITQLPLICTIFWSYQNQCTDCPINNCICYPM